MNKRNKRK